MTVYSLDGILVFGLLFVCTCAYFKKVPRLKTWLLSEKKGVWGVFYKGKVLSGHREEKDFLAAWFYKLESTRPGLCLRSSLV